MRVVIIGSGNVATVLGRLIKNRGHEILQVLSRDAAHAQTLGDILECASCDYTGVVDTSADIYFIAVQDSALYDLNKYFHLGNKLVLHSAGSISKDVLKDLSHNYGVLYPLQSLRREMDPLSNIPLLIDGNSIESLVLTEDFASTLSAMVSKAGDEERLKLHVAAVFVSNFTNHLYTLAEDFCNREHVDFKMLIPIILETANRIVTNSPAAVQTGPALRKDVFTLEKHLRLLTDHPVLRDFYLKFSESIMNR